MCGKARALASTLGVSFVWNVSSASARTKVRSWITKQTSKEEKEKEKEGKLCLTRKERRRKKSRHARTGHFCSFLACYRSKKKEAELHFESIRETALLARFTFRIFRAPSSSSSILRRLKHERALMTKKKTPPEKKMV